MVVTRQLFGILGLAGFGLGFGFGIGAGGAAENVPLPRSRLVAPPAWTAPMSFREAAGPDFKTADVTSAPSECRVRLQAMAIVGPLPRLIGPGACGGSDMVEMSAVLLSDKTRIQFKPAPVLRCAMAEQLARWVRDDAVPRVAKAGEALRAVETYDDFSCRGRNRVVGAMLSEHGKGNAVDIRAFTFASNKSVLLTDIKASKELRDGLRETACARFTTVLGPGSDGYHEEHIHVDMAERRNGFRLCQWNVRVPPPPPPPPEVVAASTPSGPAVTAVPQFAGVPVPLPPPRPYIVERPSRGKRRL